MSKLEALLKYLWRYGCVKKWLKF